MKSLNELRKDKTAITGIFSVVIMGAVVLVILSVILEIAPIIGYQTSNAVNIPADAYATGTFTFSGNVTDRQMANITNGATVYHFEFNTTAGGQLPYCSGAGLTNCVTVTLALGDNNSARASGGLTNAINNNATTSTWVTAVNTTNVTTLTAVSIGTAGNLVLAEDATNIASSGMSGGNNGNNWNPVTNAAITNGSELWQQNTPMISVTTIAIFAGLIIAVLLTIVGRRGGGFDANI